MTANAENGSIGAPPAAPRRNSENAGAGANPRSPEEEAVLQETAKMRVYSERWGIPKEFFTFKRFNNPSYIWECVKCDSRMEVKCSHSSRGNLLKHLEASRFF